jgi:hypothetical protein
MLLKSIFWRADEIVPPRRPAHAKVSTAELSRIPPTMVVVPSADSATEPIAPVPTNFGPRWVNCASASCGRVEPSFPIPRKNFRLALLRGPA